MKYIKLMRVKHYIKNILVFLPLFFSKSFFESEQLMKALIGFVCFSLLSSSVYILNDIRDVEKDRNHPQKKNRPIASGEVGIKQAFIIMLLCLVITSVLSFLYGIDFKGEICGLLYLVMNITYSMGLKNYPILDVIILASGFVFRVVYGGIITGVEISSWFYLVIISGSIFMGLGKRRNEFRQQTNSREVLKYYNEAFLDKNMYVTFTLVIVFYALWTVDSHSLAMTWTVPFLMSILMRYSYDIEGISDGDPVEVLLHDKILLSLVFIYAILIFFLLYIL